ncbi:hypothetical protein G6F57_023065 [Rhizopus arrhizus]|nr:hypothetical protein G6F57_023065 [Rhizopus arrhizus]
MLTKRPCGTSTDTEASASTPAAPGLSSRSGGARPGTSTEEASAPAPINPTEDSVLTACVQSCGTIAPRRSPAAGWPKYGCKASIWPRSTVLSRRACGRCCRMADPAAA